MVFTQAASPCSGARCAALWLENKIQTNQSGNAAHGTMIVIANERTLDFLKSSLVKGKGNHALRSRSLVCWASVFSYVTKYFSLLVLLLYELIVGKNHSFYPNIHL